MTIVLSGQNDIIRLGGQTPDEVVATKSKPSLTAEEVAYLEALPPQSKLKQAYLASTGKTELQAYQVTATQALVSGAGKPWRSSAYLDTLGWLRPVHRPILSPEVYAGTVSAAAGVVSSTASAPAAEFSNTDLVLTMAGATAEGNTDIPLFADSYGRYPEAGFRIHLRVMCTDWSQVTALRAYMVQDKATMTERYQLHIVDTSVSPHGCKDSTYSSRWNNVYRTIILTADQRTRNVGSGLNAWGGGGSDPERFIVQALRLRIATAGACVIKINRIYSPKWPIGMYGLIGDGGYDSFRQQAMRPMIAAGYNGTISLFQQQELLGAPYPAQADLAEAAAGGWDVIPHMRSLTAAAAFAGTETRAEIELSHRSLRRVITEAGVPERSARAAQFLQNSGKSNTGSGIHMAAELRKRGVVVNRGDCVDDEWGINPFAAASARLSISRPVATSITGTNNMSVPVGYCMGWVPERGRHNLTVNDLFAADPLYNPASATQRDTYAGSVHQTIVDKVASYSDAAFGYMHNILPFDGTNPTAFDTGTRYWAAMWDDLQSKVKAGRLLLLSMTDYAGLTYARGDDIYLRWDGEWVRRSDGAIAF